MFEETRVREHVFELRSALKGAARECRQPLILAWCWEKVKGLDPGWPLAGQTFKNMCSGWCSVVFGTVFENVSCFGRTAVLVDM